MACPHYQRAENRCRLLDSLPLPSPEEQEEVAPGEGVRPSICRGPASVFDRCPTYRQQLVNLRAY